MTNITPESLNANTRVREVLCWPFGFCLSNQTGGLLDTFSIKSDHFVAIASEAAGGMYLLGASGNLLYVTSEGSAGVIASSLTEGLQIMVAFPYWHDLLKFSGGGDIAEMRRAIPYLEKDLLKNEPEIESYRRFLKSELSLPEASDPIASLHYAVEVLSAGVDFELPDGEQFDSLFNNFKIGDSLT